MGVFTGIAKDARIFGRDMRNLVLIFLTPIVIMWILGNVFAETPQEEVLGNIHLGLCNHEPKFKLDYPLQLESPKDCEQTTSQMVKDGKIRGSLTVPNNFYSQIKDGYGTNLDLYLDNSKGQTSFALQTSFEALVNQLNEQIGVAFITEAWNNLQKLNDKLKLASKGLEGPRKASILLKEQTKNASDLLGDLNTHSTRNYIVDANRSLADAKLRIKDAQDVLAQSPSSQMDLSFGNLSTAPTADDLTKLFYDDCYICQQTNSTCLPQEACDSLNASITRLIDIEDQRLAAIESINNISARFTQDYGSYGALANRTAQSLDGLDLDKVEEGINKASERMDDVDAARIEALAQVRQLSEMARNFSTQIITLQSDLDKTSKFLDTYTTKDPKNIVRPVTLNVRKAFAEKKRFDFIAPGVMMITLMLVTMLISASSVVGERRSGTMVRTVLAPRPISLFIIEKVIFLLGLCAVQLALMLIAVALFGVYFSFSLGLLTALAIASLTFVALGILIGSLSKTENTALLTTLVLAIPMMFLSGVFFNFEAMPYFMNILGNLSPLTMCISLLEQIVTYGIGLSATTSLTLIVISVLAIGISIPLLKKSAVV